MPIAQTISSLKYHIVIIFFNSFTSSIMYSYILQAIVIDLEQEFQFTIIGRIVLFHFSCVNCMLDTI